MKKILIAIALSLSIISVSYGANVSYQGKNYVCDQTFPSKKLRYNSIYRFGDEFLNTGATNVKITLAKTSLEGLNYSSTIPVFSYTDWIKGRKGVVNSGERGEVLTSTDYKVVNLPRVTAPDNLLIRYDIKYKTYKNGQTIGDEKSHIECQPYSISWCGDGVLDTEHKETCDPKDPSKTGWGIGGCDEKTCEPVEIPKVKESKCENLTLTKNTLEVNKPVTFICNGNTNVNKYKIKIQKIVNNRFETLGEVFSKKGTYTFNEKGKYVISCFVEDKKTTEEFCVKPLSVDEPIIPKIKVDKRDNNPKDLDGIIGENDSQTINQNDNAVFKITVRNNGTENLIGVRLEDDVLGSPHDAPMCDKSEEEVKQILRGIGNRDEVFDIGESFTYNCERLNHLTDKESYVNKIKTFGIGIYSRIPVEDEDTTVVKKQTNFSCTNLKIDKEKQEFECNGTGSINSYRLFQIDKNEKPLPSISSNTLPFKGKYHPNAKKLECRNINTELATKDECKVEITTPPSGTSPGSCEYLKVNESVQTFECKGSGNQFEILLKDKSGKILETYNKKIGNYKNFSNLGSIECFWVN